MKCFNKFALLAAAAVTLGLPVAAPAQSAGIGALLEQARYWETHGRRDRAVEAYRRILAIDPDNEAAKRGLQGRSATPAPTPPAVTAAPRDKAAPAASAAPWRPSAADLAGRDRSAGFDALEAGNLTEAGRRFEAALSRRANDPDSLGGLGLVRLRTEQFSEARDMLRKASRLGSASRWAEALRSAEFYASLDEARAALDAGQLVQAQTLAEQLANSGFEQKAPAFELLAAIYEQQGRFMEASAMSQKAAELFGNNKNLSQRSMVNALRQKALAARETGDSAAAEQLFQQGLLADREDPWIRYEFARFLNDRGRVAETESLIRHLSQMGGTESLYAAALLLDQLDRPDSAQEIMKRIAPDQMSAEMAAFSAGLQADAAIDRAKSIAARGQTPQAVSALRQIGASGNVPPGKMADIASALFEIGDLAGAGDLARQAFAANPSDAESYEPIIRVLAQTGQESFALAALQRVNEAVGDSPQGSAMVGRLNGVIASVQADQLREAGRYAECFDLLQAAWSQAPGNVEILAALARLYQSGGMPLQAAQTFQLVLQKQPEDKGAMIGLVDSAAASGDSKLADSVLNTLLQKHPEDYEVFLAGARLERADGNDRQARAYLQRARELYLKKSGMDRGGFPVMNPFAGMRRMGGAAQIASVNPFELGTNPALSEQLGTRMPRAAYGAPVLDHASSMGASFDGMSIATSAAYSGAPAASYGQVRRPQGFSSPAPFTNEDSRMGSSGDPVLDSIERDLQNLAGESGPQVEVRTKFRDRSGETGLSALDEIGATAKLSTDLLGGRISAKADAVVIDAGRPTGSALARFGRNGNAEAQAIVDELPSVLAPADTQHASGVALSIGYESDLLEADAGTTPLGMERTQFAGGLAVTPRLSPYASGRVWVERRPVSDSVVSYAGTNDPVSGEYWGGVIRTGGGISFSWDRDGTGFYADGAYRRYSGVNVPKNEAFELNAGGYLPGYRDETSTLTFGINANYQAYDENQNFFTFGHGGYFSPQSFISVSFPMRYSYRKGPLQIDASATPGYQSYEQEGAPLYPTDAGSQALLDALKFANSDVRARYDTISKTGFGMAAEGSVFYVVSPRTKVGGEFEYNSFGDYNEFQTLLSVRQKIGNE